MKLIRTLFCLLVAVTAGWSDTSSFDDAKAGELPTGWIGSVTGRGNPQWRVASDDSAPSQPQVLKQSGEGTFPWCVLKDVSIENGAVEVRFKAVAGKEDQAAGIVWRFQDTDNYYVCRANALEDNVRIYRIVKGRRVQFGSASIKVTSNQWHTLRVEFAGSRFKVFLNGKQLFDAEDKTFTTAGKIGVWTKADSVTLFDDFWFGK